MERHGTFNLRHFLLPGFCAGMTTFSAVALGVLRPEQGGLFFLFLNIALSLFLVAILIPLARKIIPVKK